ncbi:MAG TPA: hypothetical protein VJ928_07665 [Marivita sp.]|nr:hypothetical protein [Marivita sp.]
MTLNFKLIAVLAGALFVAACDSSDSDGDDTASGVDSFGSAFRAMFDADANDEPVDAQSVDIAVDATAEPFNP